MRSWKRSYYFVSWAACAQFNMVEAFLPDKMGPLIVVLLIIAVSCLNKPHLACMLITDILLSWEYSQNIKILAKLLSTIKTFIIVFPTPNSVDVLLYWCCYRTHLGGWGELTIYYHQMDLCPLCSRSPPHRTRFTLPTAREKKISMPEIGEKERNYLFKKLYRFRVMTISSLKY